MSYETSQESKIYPKVLALIQDFAMNKMAKYTPISIPIKIYEDWVMAIIKEESLRCKWHLERTKYNSRWSSYPQMIYFNVID